MSSLDTRRCKYCKFGTNWAKRITLQLTKVLDSQDFHQNYLCDFHLWTLTASVQTLLAPSTISTPQKLFKVVPNPGLCMIRICNGHTNFATIQRRPVLVQYFCALLRREENMGVATFWNTSSMKETSRRRITFTSSMTYLRISRKIGRRGYSARPHPVQ